MRFYFLSRDSLGAKVLITQVLNCIQTVTVLGVFFGNFIFALIARMFRGNCFDSFVARDGFDVCDRHSFDKCREKVEQKLEEVFKQVRDDPTFSRTKEKWNGCRANV